MKLSKHYEDWGYLIRQEFCGYSKKRWVLRFRGDFIASRERKESTIALMEFHHNPDLFINISNLIKKKST